MMQKKIRYGNGMVDEMRYLGIRIVVGPIAVIDLNCYRSYSLGKTWFILNQLQTIPSIPI